MARLLLTLMLLISTASAVAARGTAAPKLRDLYFGEALYCAYRGEWFDAVARLDTELAQHYGLDEPELDTLYRHVNQAEFAVGDFELAYRMHHRAGRAITRVIEGKVPETVRNEAIFRLARIYFQKDQPVQALHAIQRIEGAVDPGMRENIAFLQAQILMANGRFAESEPILSGLQGSRSLEGFSTYNLGIALIKEGREQEGRQLLERTGQLAGSSPVLLALKDKANLVLGTKLLEERHLGNARLILERVGLSGPFSNRALLAAGWADSFEERYEHALVPWSILVTREITDASVQEGMLALPFAYSKLGVHSKSAVLYGSAVEKFGSEIDRLGESMESIRKGRFLAALTREEIRQDANWVVRLRELPQAPETYYLLELMASNDFQESLKNYLDLEELRRRLARWEVDLNAFDELIALRRAYYQPLLPLVDREFRRLDAHMRLRLTQRDRIEQRLKGMLTGPRPEYLATSEERLLSQRIAQLERRAAREGGSGNGDLQARIKRLKGILQWNMRTQYDQRLTEAFQNLTALNQQVDLLKKQYAAFVRTRQAATQSYQGYDQTIRRQRALIREAREKVSELMARQGHLLENMAVAELSRRRERLSEFQIKARFAMADSYDRAIRTQLQEKVQQ